MIDFKWFYIEYNQSFGLEEQWLLRHKGRAVAQVLPLKPGLQQITCVSQDGSTFVNETNHRTTIAEAKADAVFALRTIGWNIEEEGS